MCDARDACIVFRVFSIRARGVYSILCIQIPGVYAALFEKVVARVCVCGCEACVNVKRV